MRCSPCGPPGPLGTEHPPVLPVPYNPELNTGEHIFRKTMSQRFRNAPHSRRACLFPTHPGPTDIFIIFIQAKVLGHDLLRERGCIRTGHVVPKRSHVPPVRRAPTCRAGRPPPTEHNTPFHGHRPAGTRDTRKVPGQGNAVVSGTRTCLVRTLSWADASSNCRQGWWSVPRNR